MSSLPVRRAKHDIGFVKEMTLRQRNVVTLSTKEMLEDDQDHGSEHKTQMIVTAERPFGSSIQL
jgi:hypothetical protein